MTLALTAGVPLELVQKVTGHKTTDIVLKHYFQPGREVFREALNAAMPKLLTNGNQRGEDGGQKAEARGQRSEVSNQRAGQSGRVVKEEMREIIEQVTAKASKKAKARLLELLEDL